jgi:outer membrane receptor for ferrienterochelin and colicins
MEFQQKGQQITLAGRYFYEDRWGGELQWEKKNTAVELTFMVAFTQNGGSYWAYELPIAEKCCFHFLIRTTTKTPFGDMPYLAKQQALALGN